MHAKENLDLGIGRVHPADPRLLASDYAGAARGASRVDTPVSRPRARRSKTRLPPVRLPFHPHRQPKRRLRRHRPYLELEPSTSEEESVATDGSWSPAWEERQEEERWDESLVSDYVRNGRYSPTRPLWRPPRPPTPHRALQSSEEEEEEQPIIIIDSDEDEVGEQDETIVISDSEEGETPEPPRVSASYAGKVVGGRLEHRAEFVITWSEPLTTKPAGFILEEVSPPETPPQATPQQATPPPPIPQETPPQTTPPQATAPPPTPPETSMDADEEWRPIRLPARPALQRQVSVPAPPPPQRPMLQRQAISASRTHCPIPRDEGERLSLCPIFDARPGRLVRQPPFEDVIDLSLVV
ncbi:serine/arginine repetitive matrix protein 1-like [Drosophila mojavensis]|uniref:serine/arginine repetitive matrix protein 1-like n=1 Tax=Drosophila mojavensis TaxID=7230 RepID=UPI001CD1041C|nr:serine/arginine repetitive matrix protein 1-like [Drosophila mojavensis]